VRLEDLYELVRAAEHGDVLELLFDDAPVQPWLFVDLGEPDEPAAAPGPDDAPEPLSLVQAEGLVRRLLELPPGA
jgi:hypothetical protein